MALTCALPATPPNRFTYVIVLAKALQSVKGRRVRAKYKVVQSQDNAVKQAVAQGEVCPMSQGDGSCLTIDALAERRPTDGHCCLLAPSTRETANRPLPSLQVARKSETYLTFALGIDHHSRLQKFGQELTPVRATFCSV